MRRILISPHPDDAVWSCGGCLRRWAEEGDVLVVTVFDGPQGSPAAAARRAENRAALGRWQLTTTSLGFADAAVRGGGTLYPGPLARRRGIHPADADTMADVAEALRPLVREAVAVLLVPLAEGTHVDHEIARLATCAAAPARAQVRCYEEFPYRPPAQRQRQRRIVAEHKADVEDWIEGALAYAGQAALMFGSADAFARALHAHAGSGVWREWA